MNLISRFAVSQVSTRIGWRIAAPCLAVMLALGLAGWSLAVALAAPPAPSDAQPGDKIGGPALEPPGKPAADGLQVLTRGPVHEAFAETVTFDPEPGVVVPKAPPAAIEELPPDQKPEGDNVAWIPGYWAWDDERDDFLWVSGVWRLMPPDRQWVSGYWRQTTVGYQWVSGYWGDAAAAEVEYLPQAPPATLEAGPNVAAPSPDQTWIPGTWVWRQTRYMWQPGCWIAPQPNWVWVPSYYVWAPGGFIFTGGYWDYDPMSRGVLFAPIYFTAGVYSRPGFFYSPATVINLSIFGSHLFCRPSYHHYYFGDYYAANYLGVGFYPWFALHKHHGYDPIWAQQQWKHRDNRDWARHVETNYQHLRDHKDARPPHTLAAEKALAARSGGESRHAQVATPLDKIVKSGEGPARFKQLDQHERQQLATREKEMQTFRQQRQKVEAATQATTAKRPTKVALPKPPIAAGPADQLAKDQAPPARPRVSRPDATGTKTAVKRGENPVQPGKAASQPTLAGQSKPATSIPQLDKKQTPSRRGVAVESKPGAERAGEAATRQKAATSRNRTSPASPKLGGAPLPTQNQVAAPPITPTQATPDISSRANQSSARRRGTPSPGTPSSGTPANIQSGGKSFSQANRSPQQAQQPSPQLSSQPPSQQPSQRRFSASSQGQQSAPSSSQPAPRKFQQPPSSRRDKPSNDKDKDR